MPRVWGTPGIWGLDLLSPAGMGQYFGGLPIVDGQVLVTSFQKAMADGLIDVPFMFGLMAQVSSLFPCVR